MILIKNAQVFAPKALGKKDVLLAYDKILEIADCIEPWRDDLTVIDAAGKMLVPGFIDQHVHIVGGGGEGGVGLAVARLRENASITRGRPGKGSEGARGGPGILILFYRRPKPGQQLLAAVTKNKRWRLDKLGRRCIV